ncbi:MULTISPECIES: nucleotide exchange factor GrpE [Idiomarina]|jgi:molecular chaperone GrpE|uniref:Protein GrpE n=2 Tax=Idiomarina baltica TaxID=190892 RepID=A0A348WLG1_9GAMM|nr:MULTISPECIES: nucleotide exchange factor GrpE [Idiomarina]MAF74255.1 nucleotide exchange factor GrpE [Idiomarinaceae bacterium]HAR55373.1 nucleotide exchange factor GrpE [Idiomarina baltica]EAQ31198.1 Molecular chaperone GrpE (heat shock protein) [Idiomarina baltica OS145]KXS35961.1 MAG: molecular chaperone GrpE [Idiomarina sp. T82-3]MBL74499.1 nucleotide exchange factor GrpE [Idiomarinaceae bacterium]|tara:strand:+ start:680 stop:1354 length:675 start_codon:yes stop_codon:yes gene_type:complete
MSDKQPNQTTENFEQQAQEAAQQEAAKEAAEQAAEQALGSDEQPETQQQTAAAADNQADRIAELELALTKAEAKVNEQKESVLRSQAEMENVRRRASQDVEKAHKFALEKFANELLTSVDNLERAMQAADTENPELKSFLEGIELTYKSLTSTLDKFGVKAVGEEGEVFNPDLHQAMSMQESAEHKNNTIIAVMQKGYELNGRLLRPAMVMVARNSNGGVDTKA